VVVGFSVVDVDGGSDVVTLVAVGSSSLSLLMVVGVVTWRCWWLKGRCWWLLMLLSPLTVAMVTWQGEGGIHGG
jgi:hypothetical protein